MSFAGSVSPGLSRLPWRVVHILPSTLPTGKTVCAMNNYKAQAAIHDT